MVDRVVQKLGGLREVDVVGLPIEQREAHAAEPELGDLDASLADLAIAHVRSFHSRAVASRL